MMVANYATKKALKESKGSELCYTETSMFGPEFKAPGTFAMVGPSAYDRKWFAQVTVDASGVIVKVS